MWYSRRRHTHICSPKAIGGHNRRQFMFCQNRLRTPARYSRSTHRRPHHLAAQHRRTLIGTLSRSNALPSARPRSLARPDSDAQTSTLRGTKPWMQLPAVVLRSRYCHCYDYDDYGGVLVTDASSVRTWSWSRPVCPTLNHRSTARLTSASGGRRPYVFI
ncbi:hypothetical protein FKP32DRAFT_18509 [Trametes sanguinea]|nr:hypothetical protein FKP32DRAFT_18509 [Trametes sanguinea]